jgi:hypothetical protein
MPESGKAMTPMGSASSMASLRLKGAPFSWRVQSGLKTICVTLRVSAQRDAIFSAPFSDPPWISTMPSDDRQHFTVRLS